jgi:hypothetical protein
MGVAVNSNEHYVRAFWHLGLAMKSVVKFFALALGLIVAANVFTLIFGLLD